MMHEIINLRYDPSCKVLTLAAKDGSIKLLDPSPVLSASAVHLTPAQARKMAKVGGG